MYIKDPKQPAVACVIWMHGLGADAQDMVGLAEQLPSELPIRHVFIDAPVRSVTLNNHMPMRAWYDIVGANLSDREDRAGILESEAKILEVITSQLSEGYASEQIFLAGFSQGGAMALFTGLQASMPLGGILALSAYLPLAFECKLLQRLDIPIFIGSGEFDPMVLPIWTKKSVDYLVQKGFENLSLHTYPMEHAVCAEEMKDLSAWFASYIPSRMCQVGDTR